MTTDRPDIDVVTNVKPRADIIADIVGHPQGAPSFEE